MNYEYIDSDEKIEKAVKRFEKLERIAVDFECEFNLHIYGEHLCLIQIFDGLSYYLIDPRAEGVTKKGLSFFFSSSVKKLWFDCQSDASLVFKVYGLAITNIFDVRVLAELLGFHGNLKALEAEYLHIESTVNKKKNQQANWLKRPLPEEQIEYALEDVSHLMDLEDVLVPLIHERNLDKAALSSMKKATTPKEPLPGWTRLGGWKRLTKEEKIYAKHIYIARDKIARRFNVPAARVMDKHLIIEIAKNRPLSKARLAAMLENESERFRAFIIPTLWDAIVSGDKEAKGQSINAEM